MTQTRRDFVQTLLVVAGAGTAIAACGGDDTSPGGDASQSCNSITPMIGGHAGHTVSVPIADVTAGAERTYMITGAGHMHELTVTTAMFAMLAGGESVTATSTASGGHDHTVTLRCG